MESEIVRAGILIISDYLIRECRQFIEVKKNKKKRRYWVKPWVNRRNSMGISSTLLTEWAAEDECLFKNHLRMSQTLFEDLLSKVIPLIEKQDTLMRECIPVKIKLQITLRYLATGDSYSTLEALYRVPRRTISRFLAEVLTAIYVVLEDQIKVPSTTNDWEIIMNDFNTLWNFPNCCGAIDSKHVIIRYPEKSGSEFFNYKKSFSINLLAVVDANYKFIYIDVGTNGRANDALVFSKSSFNFALENNALNIPTLGVFVADDAFPLRYYLLKPFSKRGPLTKEEKVFNYRLSRARRVSDNAFGIMVSRFRIFEKPIAVQPDRVELIVKAACVLHNWLRTMSSRSNPYITERMTSMENWEEGIYLPGAWQQTTHDGIMNLNIDSSNNYTRRASEVRDNYAQQFCSSNIVPWQWQMI